MSRVLAAVLVLLLFEIPAAFCLLRAIRLQNRWADEDGVMRNRKKYRPMMLWGRIGAYLAVAGIVFASIVLIPDLGVHVKP